jgi:hypothetical protein
MINTIPAPMTGASIETVAIKPVSSSIKGTDTTLSSDPSPDTAKIAALSRQLSESAARAEKRDNDMSRSQLGDLARKLKVQFIGDIYQANKARHNLEVPDTKDPELLERARQATEFLTRKFAGDYTGKNPFTGLSREQLNVIVYDDAGPYTVNERRAAWGASQNIEQEWRTKVLAAAQVESASNSGKVPAFYTEVLAHYKSLPLIEQAQYPNDYEASLQARINEAGGQQQEEDRFLSLVEILARIPKAEMPTDSAGPDIKTSNLSPNTSPTQAAVPRS